MIDANLFNLPEFPLVSGHAAAGHTDVPDLALTFHHLGLAVQAPEQAAQFLCAMGYVAEAAVYDPAQKVNLRMFRSQAMPDVELIWPGAEPSPINNIVLKHGSAIYHTCYTCRDRGGALARMKDLGLRVVELSPPTPAVLFGGKTVSFYGVLGFGIIEVIDVAAG